MSGHMTVDYARLSGCATEVASMAEAVAKRRSGLVDPLVSAEAHLSGATSAAQLTALSEAVLDVHADLGTALGGLGQGLESVVTHLREVDRTAAGAARAGRRGR